MATIPLFTSSPRSVSVSTDTGVPNNTGFYPWPFQTDLDNTIYPVAFGSNMPDLRWNPTEPALGLSTSSHSESTSGECSDQSSPVHSISAQNDAGGRLEVPRIRYLKCPACQSLYPSESRLSKHLRTSHAPARFSCGTCDRGFKFEKDLKRHQPTHEPLEKQFACSCAKTYTRNDLLLRHIRDMVPRLREAGRHNAIKSTQK